MSFRCLVQKVSQLLAPAGMAQFPQRFGLDLPDTLSGDVELFSDFLESSGPPVHDAEAQFQHLLFARRQGVQHFLKLLPQQREACRFTRLAGVFIGDKVSKVAVLLHTVLLWPQIRQLWLLMQQKE